MSTNLIERLREHGNYGAGTTNQAMNLCNEAADRIAALEAAVYEHKTAADAFEVCWKDAKAALEAEASEGDRRGLERAAVDRTAAIESFRRWYFNHTGKRIYYNNAGVAVNVVLDAALIPEAPAREGE